METENSPPNQRISKEFTDTHELPLTPESTMDAEADNQIRHTNLSLSGSEERLEEDLEDEEQIQLHPNNNQVV